MKRRCKHKRNMSDCSVCAELLQALQNSGYMTIREAMGPEELEAFLNKRVIAFAMIANELGSAHEIVLGTGSPRATDAMKNSPQYEQLAYDLTIGWVVNNWKRRK